MQAAQLTKRVYKACRDGATVALLTLVPLSVSQSAGAEATPAPSGTSAPAQLSSRVIILGTASGPVARPERSEPANLVQVGDRIYLVDAGSGVSHALARAGLQPSKVHTTFITHLHFDHVGGLASMLGFSWVMQDGQPIDIYGPPGTEEFVKGALNYLAIPIGIHAVRLPRHRSLSELVKTHEIDTTGPTIVFQDDRIRVTAIANTHFETMQGTERAPGASRSYSYRFDIPGRSIVFTGDTGMSEPLIALAKGADILVSEVNDLEQSYQALRAAFGGSDEQLRGPLEHMRHEHLTPEQVGDIARRAGVKFVVLTHIGISDGRETDMRRYTEGVRKTFSGPVVVAHDGDEF